MVSLIIVDYKTIPKTLQYIRDCYEMITDSIEMHTIIVDNCEDSTYGMKLVEQAAESNFTRAEMDYSAAEVFQCRFEGRPLLYVCAQQNLGYAKGNNLGAEIARYFNQDDYYLFSNNDLHFPHKFAIQQLLAPMQREKEIAVVGPRIEDKNGNIQTPRKRSSAWIQLFVNYYDMLLPMGMKITDKITDVDKTEESRLCYWVTGSFFVADAFKFHQVEGFDNKTFLYCEEVILAERLLRQGFHMYYENSVTVIHEHGQTVKAAFSALKGIRISFQSALYYYQQYRDLNAIVKRLAQVNYFIFSIFFMLKKNIAKIINGGAMNG